MIIVGVFFAFFYSFVFYDPVLEWGRLDFRLILSFVFRSFNLNDVEYALNTGNIDDIKMEEQRMGFRLGFLWGVHWRFPFGEEWRGKRMNKRKLMMLIF